MNTTAMRLTDCSTKGTIGRVFGLSGTKSDSLSDCVIIVDKFMNKKMLLLAVLLMGITGGSHAEKSGGTSATIIYSGNLDGELEPCGCSEAGDLGGILRRASKIQELRRQNPSLFLISSGGLLANASPRDRLKSEYILKGIAAMDYDAIGLQWRDLSYGVDFIKKIPLPWVVTNWRGQAVFPSRKDLEHGEVRMAFFAWLNPEDSPFRQMRGDHNPVNAPVEQLENTLRETREKGVLTVLSFPESLERVAESMALDNVDILIVQSAYEKYGQPRQHGKTLVLQPGSRGMRLGRVNLQIDNKGSIASWRHEVIPLPESVPDAPFLKTWYDEYNAGVKAAYLASVEKRKQLQSGQSPYTGSEACQGCHEKPYTIWRASPHAAAFEKLEEVGKSFDPDCIVCHTVGFEKPGGYIDARLTMHLLDVQCESCHGAGRAHVESQGRLATPNAGWPREKICNQCHTQPHSPGFDFDSYWARIAH